jgi:hypothetical protein
VLALLTMLLALAVAACGGGSREASGPPAAATTLPKGSETVRLDPGRFTTQIDNRYWPMKPGSRWLLRETDKGGDAQRVEITVTDQTKTIMGIEARVVHDKVTNAKDGSLVEDTYDWYAQDDKGNIWYLGEDTKEYENGKIASTKGSWEHGVKGAYAGIIIPANPRPGLTYRQEYYKGEAEDKTAVITVGKERVQVPFGYFNKDILMTRDLVPTEPKVQELKCYAPNVGPLLSVHTDGAGGRAELVSYSQGG